MPSKKMLTHAPKITLPMIKKFVGAAIMMGVIRQTSARAYWEGPTRVSQISENISRNDFETVRRFIHFNNNETRIPSPQPGYDPLFKIRPIVDKFVEQCRSVPKEQWLSVDEQMIPFKGASSLKKYNPKKAPNEWGYEAHAICESSGFPYDWAIYIGKESNRVEQGEPDLGASSNVVVRMLRHIEPGKIIVFDNWFTSLPLLAHLEKSGFHAIGTIRKDRLPGNTLKSETDLRREGRGAFDSEVTTVHGVEIKAVRWLDKGAVNLVSTFVGEEPFDNAVRYDRKKKEQVNVRRPLIVTQYNSHMGGVDLLDMLVALHRTKLRSHKYYMRLFYHIINLACVQAWLLYKRSRSQFRPREKPMILRKFVVEVAERLMRENNVARPRARGRPSRDLPDAPPRCGVNPHPLSQIRLDQVSHWPESVEKGRCRVPDCGGYSRWKCTKCDIRLCLSSEKKCFYTYHNE